MPRKQFVVTGIVDGSRKELTKPLSKKKATATRNSLKRDMKTAIPKYRWTSGLRIKEVRRR